MQTTIVYLLHFSMPYKHARHYIGSAVNLEQRLAQHEAGTAARLTQVVRAAGISFVCARTWQGNRQLERKLKSMKHAARLCPSCKK